MSLKTRIATMGLAVLIFSQTPASAETVFPEPTGEVILTVSGEIPDQVEDVKIPLDLDTLRGFDPVTFETTTVWTEGVQVFTGFLLYDLIEKLGIEEGVLHAQAINDYAIEIPVDAITENAPIIAYERNGEEMSVRDKGPLWVVFPYDSAPGYQTETVYSMSIWQLDRILVQGVGN